MNSRALLVVLLAVGCSRSTPTIGSDPANRPAIDANQPAPPPPTLPDGWIPKEMAEPMGDDGSPQRVIEVLAYKSLVDDRPLYLDEAILWVHDPPQEVAAEGWTLVHVYRHPKDDAAWNLSQVYDAFDYVAIDRFDHAPTLDETKSFFEHTWWWSHDDFRILQSDLPPASWMAAYGTKPIDLPPAWIVKVLKDKEAPTDAK